MAPDPPGNIEAGDVGKADVEHDRVHAVTDEIEAVAAIGGHLHDVAIAGQQLLEEIGKARVVLDDKDVHLAQYRATGS